MCGTSDNHHASEDKSSSVETVLQSAKKIDQTLQSVKTEAIEASKQTETTVKQPAEPVAA